MNKEDKFEILRKSARFDLCGDCDLRGNGRIHGLDGRWRYPDFAPDGEKSNLLRVLLTNHCENDCPYCENAASRDHRRVVLLPDEVAAHYAELHRRGQARSLFLSSAVRHSAEHTMTRMVEVLDLIRNRYRIPAYIHAKILPGASDSLVTQTLRLANRVSVNLETPNALRMGELGNPKRFKEDLYDRVQFICRLLENPAFRKKSQTTQFVVGAARETDQEILQSASHLYQDLKISRIYFSAFQPLGKDEFGSPRSPLLREHRLYQADFLLRKYRFKVDEIPLGSGSNLSLTEDPKTVWARLHPEFFPLEVNRAAKGDLLRVPGLGPVYVSRIIQARRAGKLSNFRHLQALGILKSPCMDYLLLDGDGSHLRHKKLGQSRLNFA